jgi:exopolysaccharide biosynthesis polyprenyl glycosylphosphotransferase
MRKRSELLFGLILVPVDFLALITAFVAAYIIRVRLDGRPVAHPIPAHVYLEISLLVLPIWLLIFAFSGLYSLSNLRGKLDELGRIFVAVSGGVMTLILLDFFQKNQPLFPSKSVPIYAYGIGFLLVVIARSVIRLIQRSLFRYGVGVHQTLMIGSGELAQRIAHDMESPRSGYRIVGIVESSSGAGKRLPGYPLYKSVDEVKSQIAGGLHVDEIVQADSGLEADDILELVTFATNNHISYRFIPNQFGLYATNAVYGTMAGMPVLEIRLTSLEGWGRIVKRAFDVVGAGLGLILLSPIFLGVALAIKIADPGPIFFRQRRLSRAGSEVYMYKFRSMKHKFNSDKNYKGKTPVEIFQLLDRPELVAEFEEHQKVRNDPRVSKIGDFLRRSSLDELPQLLNAFMGDMSLVGPRPIVPVELERYGNQSGSFLALKPGITGLWQISGRSDVSYEDRVKLDIYYVENWSLWLDIKILLKTIVAITKKSGAY